MAKNLLFFLILIFSLVICLYRISELPGEWYGDISNVHEYVQQILSGKLPFYFFQSPGPFYHYLITPLVLLFRNQGYETYKYASIAVSLISLSGIYLFVKETAGRKIAIMSALIVSFSFWHVVWSRLGNSQVVIPGIAAFSFYFIVRYLYLKNFKDLVASVFVSSLGWYTYPQTFVFPILTLLILLSDILISKRVKGRMKSVVILFCTSLLAFTPFIYILANQNKGMEGNFAASGYVGSKILPVFKMKPKEFIIKLSENLGKTYSML